MSLILLFNNPSSKALVLSDTFLVDDVLLKLPLKQFVEQTAMFDNSIKTTNRNVDELFALFDSISKLPQKFNNELIQITDFLSRFAYKFLFEVTNILDNCFKFVDRIIVDVFNINDLITRNNAKLCSDNFTIVDAMNTGIFRQLFETTEPTDFLLKSASITIAETILFLENFLRSSEKVFFESINFPSSLTKLTTKLNSVSFFISDTISQLILIIPGKSVDKPKIVPGRTFLRRMFSRGNKIQFPRQ